MTRHIFLWQDMASNDEGASGSDLRHKRMEAASRLGGLMPEPSFTEMNGFRLRDSSAALLPVKLESTSAEPQTYLKGREELHGSGRKDPIRVLFQSESGWQDPFCTLFQTRNIATCQVENPDAGGSCTLATPLKESDASSRRVNLKNGVSIDYAVKEKDHRVAPKCLQVHSGRSWNCIFASILVLYTIFPFYPHQCLLEFDSRFSYIFESCRT